jgi:hypothetical protein
MTSQKESPRNHHGFENLTTALIDGGNSAISGGEMSVTCFPRLYKVTEISIKMKKPVLILNREIIFSVVPCLKSL